MEHCQAGMVLSNTYELLSKLGQGGMGEVWVARHVRLPEKPVAVKVIYHSDENLLERLRREARVMAGLNHPHIAHIVDLDALPNGHPFMVMELLSGAPLSETISQGKYDQEAIDEWIYQLGDALNTAHKHGIIHRDLKPDNLFLCDDQSLKVLDFGLSKISHMGRLSTTGALLGTPYYMSPEQINGDEVDERSDLFALGLICIELITKYRPITGHSLPQIFKSIREYRLPACPPDFDPKRWVLINDAIAQNPDDRTSTVAQWVEAFIKRSLPNRRLNKALISQDHSHSPSLDQTLVANLSEKIVPDTIISESEAGFEDTVNLEQSFKTQSSTEPSNKSKQVAREYKSQVNSTVSNSVGSDRFQIAYKTNSAYKADHSQNHSVTDTYHKHFKLIWCGLFITGLVFFFYVKSSKEADQQMSTVGIEDSSSQSDLHTSTPKPFVVKGSKLKVKTKVSVKAQLPLDYQVAIEQAKQAQRFKYWAPLLLLKEQLKRFPNQPYVGSLQKAFDLLEREHYFEFEQAMKEVKVLLSPHEDHLKKYIQALLTLSYCQSNAFKAYQSYQKLALNEQALVDPGLGKCKGKFFKTKTPHLVK